MATVQVHASKNYQIHIENGLLDRIGSLSAELLQCRNVALVTDETVDALYADRVEKSLLAAGFAVHKLVLPAGEETKCLARFGEVLEFFSECRLTRTDAAFALGGGVIGDLTGFACAVYLRGIRYVQIPTTLLAAVDSSVGGKTAIDLQAGKNLAGAFHQPAAVFCDPETLQTLPCETFSDGCAEVIKYAVLDGEPLVSLLANRANADWCNIIYECVKIKKRMVEEDEFDTGVRMFLNLGHTVGHAIEKNSHFAITHGKAVAIGMVIAARLSEKLGLCDASLTESLTELLHAYGLPTESPYAMEDLIAGMLSDKKRKGNTLHLILPQKMGKCTIYETDVEVLHRLFE